MEKKCTSCGLFKPLIDFTNASGGNYLRSKCKKCEKAQVKIRKELKKIYLPPTCCDYECPICNRTADQCASEGNKKNGPWVLDHDPKTGEFRGYICHTCNRSIGGFKDNVIIMNNAIEYLNKTVKNTQSI
jgi:hypothetical protein